MTKFIDEKFLLLKNAWHFETIEKIDLYLKNTLKIPSAILMIFYYLGLIWLFTRFIHLLIIIAEYLGFS